MKGTIGSFADSLLRRNLLLNSSAALADGPTVIWPSVTAYNGVTPAFRPRRFLDDGRLEVDNNIAKRALRGVAIGRRNWLFAGSRLGGERAAAIYTIIQPCKTTTSFRVPDRCGRSAAWQPRRM